MSVARRSVVEPRSRSTCQRPLEDELEVGGLDTLAGVLRFHRTAPRESVVDPPGADLVESSLHELGLGRVALAAEPVVLLEGADDR